MYLSFSPIELEQYAVFDRLTLQLRLNINSELEVGGYYGIQVSLTDAVNNIDFGTGAGLTSYPLIIYIAPNSEPYFETWEGIIHLKENSGKQSYLLPEIKDPEGYEVQIDFGFGNTAPFTVWDQSTRQLIFYLNDESAVVGAYIIAVSLKDESHKVFYYLDVIIEENTAPYFGSSEIGHIDGSMKEGSLLNIYTLSQMIDDEGD